MKKNVFFSIVLIGIMVTNVVALNNRNLFTSVWLTFNSVESLAQNEFGGGPPTCMAGGCHSAACSFEGEIGILGNGVTYKNSTSCVDAWACCFTTAYCFPKNLCNW